MDAIIDPDSLIVYWTQFELWIRDQIYVHWAYRQAIVVAVVFVLAAITARSIRPRLEQFITRWEMDYRAKRFLETAVSLIRSVIWLVFVWLALFVFLDFKWSVHVLNGVASLLTAWVVIRLATSLVRDAFWSRTIAITAWSIAALNIVGLLDPLLEFLNSLAFSVGNMRVSVLGIFKGLIALTVLLWAAGFVSRLVEKQIKKVSGLSPSVQVLFGKFLRVALYVLAFLIALESIGIDLTTLAVFSGALGLGIGIGLQKIVSNLVSGVILLIDRSVKPGDVISIGNTYGTINKLGARFVSVISRNGIEYLIPNDELVSQQVENWSHSHSRVRVRTPIGVSYDSDIPKARELALIALKENERVLEKPRPACNIREFADNSVNLELLAWIEDPDKGLGGIRSKIYERIWDLYHEHGISFPFPQRDLHIKSSVPLNIKRSEEE